MKHAGPAAVDRLEPLLVQIRPLPGLVEKRRGVFYRKGKAFLPFHEDPAGLFADVRFEGTEFTRVRVETVDEQAALFARLASFATRS